MALTEPRRSTFEIRNEALSRALQLHEAGGPTLNHAHVIDSAKAFEGYLAGPTPASRVEGDSTTKGSYALPPQSEVDEAQEQWRIDIERLPYDGHLKRLNDAQMAYRVEVLARIVLEDVNEDRVTRQDALDELRAVVAALPDFTTDGAE